VTTDSLSAATVVEEAMMDPTQTREAPGQRPPRARKICLDSAVYCLHSVRASAGDPDCDHDFEQTPTVKQADFAVWNCTRCGRAFKYEVSSPSPDARLQKPIEARPQSSAGSGDRH
jgi:hypothetical protein